MREERCSNMEVEVRCYSGFKGEERPLSFTCAGRTFEVTEVKRSWAEEDRSTSGGRLKACFRVKADDGKVYTLSRDEQDGRWTLEGMTGA
jgi:hypothetical protein